MIPGPLPFDRETAEVGAKSVVLRPEVEGS